MFACAHPVYVAKLGHSVSCGRCFTCRLLRTYEWAQRLADEALDYARPPLFVMLSYAPEHLPANGLLDSRDLTLFFKRLRKNVDLKFKYYAVGEYGSRKERPHYHVIFFGLDMRHRQQIFDAWGKCLDEDGHYLCEPVRSTRGYKYVAGYVRKKIGRMVEQSDSVKQCFARQSNGIGKNFALTKLHLNSDFMRRVGDKWRIPCRYYRKILCLGKELYEDHMRLVLKEQLSNVLDGLSSIFGDRSPLKPLFAPDIREPRSLDDLSPWGRFVYRCYVSDLNNKRQNDWIQSLSYVGAL